MCRYMKKKKLNQHYPCYCELQIQYGEPAATIYEVVSFQGTDKENVYKYFRHLQEAVDCVAACNFVLLQHGVNPYGIYSIREKIVEW